MSQHTIRGFIKGFTFTLLILILAGAVAGPIIGRAQDGEPPNNLSEASPDAAGTTGRTDDPLGRQPIPLENAAHPPNDSYTAADEAAVSSRTDDPLGRTRIPLADSPASPADNLAFTQQHDAPFDPAANQAAVAREAALRQEASQQYTSPLVVPAADFTDDGFDPDSLFYSFGGGYFAGNADAYGCLIAPAYLPQGVTVTDMFVSVYDNDGSRNTTITLRRVDNFTGSGTSMASASTSGAFAGIQTVSTSAITAPVVLYPDYSYYLTACLGSNSLRLYSARLYYTQP